MVVKNIAPFAAQYLHNNNKRNLIGEPLLHVFEKIVITFITPR